MEYVKCILLNAVRIIELQMYILELDFVSSHNKIAVTEIMVYMIQLAMWMGLIIFND